VRALVYSTLVYFTSIHFTSLHYCIIGLALVKCIFIPLHLYTFVPSTPYAASPINSVDWLEVGGPFGGLLIVSYTRVGRGAFAGLLLIGLSELLKPFPSLRLYYIPISSTGSVPR
jgi:hypothetical protein